MPKHRLPQTFPHLVIFVSSLTLCMCAIGGVVVAVLSWNNHVWGYYFGTGFWSGGVILLAGIFGIAASYVRNAGSVKTFMIFAIFGFIVSLAMIALSCGGLDPDSGFYNDYPDGSLWNTVCHGAYLGLGVLQLSICILSDAICVYYLFVEPHSEIYSVKLRGKGKPLKRSRAQSKDKNRSSTTSSAPLIGGSTKPKSGTRNSKKRKSGEENHVEKDDTEMPIKRNRGSFVKSQNGLDSSTPIRSPCVRPASFTTFFRSDEQERASLIVHPGDNNSVADTYRSHISDESPYGHSLLYEPPLPIEEDEELPPYELKDSKSYVNVVMRMNTRECPASEFAANGFKMRRTNSAPLHHSKSALKRRRDFKRNSQSKLSSVPSRETDNETANDFSKYIIDRPDLSTGSIDRLNNRHASSDNVHSQTGQTQGVQLRDFSKSSDRIMDDNVAMRENRSQSVRVDRESRLDRRRRALSVELRPSKQQRIDESNDFDLQRQCNTTHDSTPAIYAGSKAMPSKFSLRTRLSQKRARSPVPVKSITSLPLFSPPPKPPRTHSVTLDELFDEVSENPYESVEDVKKKMKNIGAVSLNRDTVSSVKKTTSAVTQIQANEQTIVNSINELKLLENEVKSKDIRKKEPLIESPEVVKTVFVPVSGQTNPYTYRDTHRTTQISRDGPNEKIQTDQGMPGERVIFSRDRPSSNVQIVSNMPGDRAQVDKDRLEHKIKNDRYSPENKAQIDRNGPSYKAQPTWKRSDNKTKSKDGEVFIFPNYTTTEKAVVSQPNIKRQDSTTIDRGPLINLKMPVNQIPELSVNKKISDTSGKDSSHTITSSNNQGTMALPLSPVIKPPAFNIPKSKENTVLKPEPIYSQINKKPPETKPKPNVYRRSAGAVNTVPDRYANKDSNARPTSTEPPVFNERADISGVELRARPTPLSPSERILQKANDRPGNNTRAVPPSVERRSVEVGRNLFLPSTEYSGARPKTSPIRRTNSEDPDERPIRPLLPEVQQNAPNGSYNRPLPQPFNYKSRFSFVYPSNTSPKSPVSPITSNTSSSFQTRQSINSGQGVQQLSSPRQSSQSVQRTNINDTQNGLRMNSADSGTSRASGSASSQGVLHLQQSQYAPRQVTDNRNATVAIGTVGNANAANVPPQPVQQQQNDEQDGEKPLFSFVL